MAIKKLIMVLDTETTGLDKINEYIVQIAYIVYDTVLCTEMKELDFIIRVPKKITNSHIHNITDLISSRGYEFEEIIDIILEDIKSVDIIVGHNINFDLQMMEVELDRLNRFEDIDMIYSKTIYDTMLNSIDICKIKGKFGKNKWPKLSELYNYFFQCEFEDQHNALGDIRATLQCYKKLNFQLG